MPVIAVYTKAVLTIYDIWVLFLSNSLYYLLHCLPGNIQEKARIFEIISPLLNTGGHIFGSTLLQGNVSRNYTAKKLMHIYNSKGIFSNQQDTLPHLEESLKNHFDSYTIELKGCVALFRARKSGNSHKS